MNNDATVLQRAPSAGGTEVLLDLMADALKDMLRAHDAPTASLARRSARNALQAYASLADCSGKKGGLR